MIPLSSNAFSVDDQIADAVSYVMHNAPSDDVITRFRESFPGWDGLTWSGSWVDTEESGVDVEYTSWVADWLEANTDVQWIEGEPFAIEEGDEWE